MHMYKEHNGAAPVQKSCNICLFTSHLSRILKHHMGRKYLGMLKMFEGNRCNFSAKSKCVLKHLEHLKQKKTTWQYKAIRVDDASHWNKCDLMPDRLGQWGM